VEVRPTRIIVDGTPFEIDSEYFNQFLPNLRRMIWKRFYFDLRLPVPAIDKSRETDRDYFDFLVKNYKEYFPKIGIQLKYT
jgi:hypothetical protein